MKKHLKLFAVLSLVFLLSSILAGVASADVIRGAGWLYAKGSGEASLRMTGHVEIKSHGVGAVYIYGAESIEAHGDGQRKELSGGGVLFWGHKGIIKVVGERMTVRMEGRKIEFTAHGKGVIQLRGRGHYKTRGHSGDWAPDGLTVEVEEK